MKQYRDAGIDTMSQKERRPRDWTIRDRLSALITTGAMDEKEKARWCRENGLHSHHLVGWKKEIESNQGDGAAEHRLQSKHLRDENRQLKKELRRKEKALAETSALLVLKKKAHLIWGDSEED